MPSNVTSSTFRLRNVEEADLPIFFEQQLDPEANYMAAFIGREPSDRSAFDAHWRRILNDDKTINKTIVVDGQVVGYIASFMMFGEREVGYWIGKEHWGKGIATRALAALLGEIETRPLYAHAAKDNIASIRVLQKCGFVISGEDKSFAKGRGEEVEEYVLVLAAD
jgi:RimJ/RimL family protein N-acetyltransferase